LVLALCVYLVLALGSLEVDPQDPTREGANWVGPVGAAIAGLLAQGFGVVAWGLPMELFAIAVPLVRGRPAGVSGLRVAGDLVVAILASVLVHVAAPTARAFAQLPAAGNVGLLFGELSSALFSTLGSFLVAGTAIVLILVSRASFSFIHFAQATLRFTAQFWVNVVRLTRRVLQAWRTARRLHAEERARLREQNAPKIDTVATTDALICESVAGDPWQPAVRTGTPPLALANSLRESLSVGLAQTRVVRLTTPPPPVARAATPAPDAAPTSESANPSSAGTDTAAELADATESSAGRSKKRAPLGKPETQTNDAPGELKIVDTQKLASVERAPKQRPVRSKGFTLPDSEILDAPSQNQVVVDRARVLELADRLEKTLLDYGVTGKVEEVHPGPTVTTYEVSPNAGTKVSKVASLCDDLALGLSRKVRIIAPIPGKARIGFELPNDERVPVSLRELIEDKRFKQLSERAPLPVVLGRDIVGAPFYADLAAMPHVIVAGSTGAGKSVGLNVMLASLLFKRSPDELRMLMIDPKVVELAPFDGIPHMLLPVVTDMRQAAKALKWAVDEMERRYQAFAIAGTKNIDTFNRWVQRVQDGELPAPEPAEVQALTADGSPVSVPAAKTGSDGAILPGRMPHIVIVVDEFADLMMQQGKEVEACVARLAQKARAAGMHVVLATQRPSVDVITGMIKANFPTRIAFRVAQKVDSRTILDEMGAELLLGRGDMLIKLNGASETYRVQCPFISEEEVERLTEHLRTQGAPVYHDDILKGGDDEEQEQQAQEDLDSRYDEAVRIVAETQRCSTSWLQRKMTIGYNRAAKIVEAMEARGVVGPANGSKEREIFVHPQ
jgi:S-DNA-T family DNA segregation ATPase FtsK/SpoIIIE